MGLFIPCFAFPFAKPSSPFDGLYGKKESVTRYEIVLKKGEFSAGEGYNAVQRYVSGSYKGRIILPYRYILAFGITLVFAGCAILLLSKLSD